MSKKYFFIALTAILFIVGLFFWLQDLKSDPPMHFSGLGQGLTTDPAQYVYHARNKVLFDEFDIFDDPRWSIFQHSLNSLVAYVVFYASEISYERANIVGVLLSLFGLLFFLGGIYDNKRPWIILLFTLLYLTNITLFVYGRVPFLENALLFYVGLIFLIHSRWSDERWSVIAIGILISLAILTAKIFGLFLLPAIILSLYFSNNDKRWLSIIWLTVSTTVSFILSAILLYGTDFKYVFGFVFEQGVDIRGFPDGLRSPVAFIEHLLNFGADNRLFYINFDLLIYFVIAMIIIAMQLRRGSSVNNLPASIKFPLFLIVISILIFAPANYAPLRYALFLIPLMLVLFVGSFTLFTKDLNNKKQSRYPLILYLFPFWFLLVNMLIVIFFRNNYSIQLLCWGSLPVAILFTYLFDRFVKYKKNIHRKILVGIISLIVICGFMFNIYRYTEFNINKNIYTITEASTDLGMILGDNAVITGINAPVLVSNNDNLRAYIHHFTLIDQPADLFNKIPITHIALSDSERDLAFKLYPKLKESKPIVTYWLRNIEISIYYIGNVFLNSQTSLYKPTAFEKAMLYELDGYTDSSYLAIKQFMSEETSSKSANLLYAQILLKMGKYDESMQSINRLTFNYPTDSYLLLQCARTTQFISMKTNNQSLYKFADKLYEKAVDVNPYSYQYARQIFENTQNLFQKR